MAFAGKIGPEESTPIAFFGWRREVGETERGKKGKRRMTKVENGGMKKEEKGEGGREEAQRGVGIRATNRAHAKARGPRRTAGFARPPCRVQ
jgi:hypothetical protein